MLQKFLILCALVSSSLVFAQFEDSNRSVRFDGINSSSDKPSGFEMPAVKKPSISNNNNSYAPNNSDLGVEKEKQFDFQKGDGLVEYKTKITPKAFTEDKEAKPEYGKDMYLGDFKTKAKYVTVMYRDHEYVDGDRIRVYVNGEMVVSSVRLEAQFQGFNMPLLDGFNRVEFEALNQGTSGPNTAQLHVYDEVGNLLADYEWNLLTGNKATAIVVKQ